MNLVIPTLLQGEWSSHLLYIPYILYRRFQLTNAVSSGSTAKSWSCHSTTPNFSSTSTSTLIETLQMHVSHASFSVLFHCAHLYWFPALFVLILHIHPEQQTVCWISMCVYVFVHCIFYSLSWYKRFSTCKSWSQGQSMTLIITIS